MIVVADSSPLIYLSRLGLLELLPRLYGEVVVPGVVWAEVVEMRPDAPGAAAIRDAAWLRVPDDERGTIGILVRRVSAPHHIRDIAAFHPGRQGGLGQSLGG